MSTPELLLLSTYPIVKPRHGGQLRARALARAYREGGFNVTSVAVVEKGAWPRQELGPRDIEFPVDDPRWFIGGRDIPATADLRSGTFAVESEEHLQTILDSLPSRLSAIHLEQPYLFPLARRILREKRHEKAVLVYGSANIEAPLREAIFRQTGIEGGEEVVERVLALEQEAARSADLSLAVAPFDHQTLVSWGAKKVIRAPNGIDEWKASRSALSAWTEKLKGVRRFALFVASAHPPNFDGFFRAFGDALGFIPPDCRIVVAGSVGPYIAGFYDRARFNSLNRSRLEITGVLDDDDLAALKTLTTVFLLPIFEGGGSNIKTAEALISGKLVLASTTSLRGFDAWSKLPELRVADTQEEFRTSLREILTPGHPVPEPSARAKELRELLLWTTCLAPAAPAVHEVLSRR